MLRTCNRCKQRRVKCDTQLPACANCVKSSSRCTFKDCLDKDVPRAYVKSLYDKIEKLEAQIHDDRDSLPQSSSSLQGHQLIPDQPYSFKISSDTSPTASICNEQLPVAHTISVTIRILMSDHHNIASHPQPQLDDLAVPLIVGRDAVTPWMLKSLISHYTAAVFPTYPLPLIYEDIGHESHELDNMPVAQKFHILMACALAALHRSQTVVGWSVIARICRDWAGELAVIMCKRPTQEALIAAVALLVYETVDPSRGMVWILYDWAMRQCLQLGWHSFQDPGERPSVQSPETASPLNSSLASSRAQTLSVLQHIHISLKLTFNRPSMLDTLILSKTAEEVSILKLHAYIRKDLETTGEQCLFSEERSLLTQMIEEASTTDPTTHELWMLLFPVLVNHQKCVFCDDNLIDHMKKRVLWSAREIVNSTHKDVILDGALISPVFAAVRILNAGCVLAVALRLKWDQHKMSSAMFAKCTEVLTMCGTRWNKGIYYCNIWRIICSALDRPEHI